MATAVVVVVRVVVFDGGCKVAAEGAPAGGGKRDERG